MNRTYFYLTVLLPSPISSTSLCLNPYRRLAMMRYVIDSGLALAAFQSEGDRFFDALFCGNLRPALDFRVGAFGPLAAPDAFPSLFPVNPHPLCNEAALAVVWGVWHGNCTCVWQGVTYTATKVVSSRSTHKS